jgi:hypothetical protein
MNKLITPEDFNLLGYHEQTEAVLKGTFLADLLTEDAYVKLYDVNGVYVEVFFDDVTHLITHFTALENILLAMPYLNDLKIAV